MKLEIVDFTLVAFILIFLVIGYKKGLIKSFLNLASLLVVTAFVPNISAATSEKIYNSFLEKKVSNITENLVSNGFSKYPKKRIDNLVRNLDPVSSYILKNSKACDAESLVLSKTNSKVMNDFIKEKALSYINFLVTLVMSFIFLFLFHILFRKFSVKKLPILGSADALLGGALGVLECLVLFFALFKLFTAFSMFFSSSGSNSKVYNNIIESASFKYFKEFDSLSFMK